jgi:hypothetical protein
MFELLPLPKGKCSISLNPRRDPWNSPEPDTQPEAKIQLNPGEEKTAPLLIRKKKKNFHCKPLKFEAMKQHYFNKSRLRLSARKQNRKNEENA